MVCAPWLISSRQHDRGGAAGATATELVDTVSVATGEAPLLPQPPSRSPLVPRQPTTKQVTVGATADERVNTAAGATEQAEGVCGYKLCSMHTHRHTDTTMAHTRHITVAYRHPFSLIFCPPYGVGALVTGLIAGGAAEPHARSRQWNALQSIGRLQCIAI